MHLAPMVLILAILMSPSQAFSMGKHQPKNSPPAHLMGVMGDSIPSGTFADTTTSNDFRATIPYLQETILNRDWKTLISGIRWDAPILIQNKPTYSWASGERVDSHYVRLRSLIERASRGAETLAVLNVAIPGKRTEALGKQADELVKAARSGKYLDITYIAMMVGSNDVCRRSGPVSDEEMARNLRDAFHRLAQIRQTEPIRILVSSIPSISALGRQEVQESITLGKFSCAFARSRIFKFCPGYTKWNSVNEFEEQLAFIVGKNRVIERAVADANSEFHNLDIHYSNRFFETEINSELLAMDCFHPNRRGHETISSILWDDQPWFK